LPPTLSIGVSARVEGESGGRECAEQFGRIMPASWKPVAIPARRRVPQCDGVYLWSVSRFPTRHAVIDRSVEYPLSPSIASFASQARKLLGLPVHTASSYSDQLEFRFPCSPRQRRNACQTTSHRRKSCQRLRQPLQPLPASPVAAFSRARALPPQELPCSKAFKDFPAKPRPPPPKA
jgi:hypothetical protein